MKANCRRPTNVYRQQLCRAVPAVRAHQNKVARQASPLCHVGIRQLPKVPKVPVSAVKEVEDLKPFYDTSEMATPPQLAVTPAQPEIQPGNSNSSAGRFQGLKRALTGAAKVVAVTAACALLRHAKASSSKRAWDWRSMLDGPPVALPHAPVSKWYCWGLRHCFRLHGMIPYERSCSDSESCSWLSGLPCWVNGALAEWRKWCCTSCLLRLNCKSYAVTALCVCLASCLGCSSTSCYSHCIQTVDPAMSSNILCLSVHGAITGSRHVYMSTNESFTFGVTLPTAASGTVFSKAVSTQLLLDSYSACAAAGLAIASESHLVLESKAVRF